MSLVIAVEDPSADDVQAVLRVHVDFARAVTPAEDVHALEPSQLANPAVTLFGARRDGRLEAVGALRTLGDGHGELKSMHTLESARGAGVGRAMLEHLLAEAVARELDRVSLETGTMDAFAPARALYVSAGFTPCPPFGEYSLRPGSICMTIDLTAGPPTTIAPARGFGGRAEVVTAHVIPERPPLRIGPGDQVEVGDRDDRWPAFVFVTTDAGSGWVPWRYLSATRPMAVAREPYDTTELSTCVGDRLDVVQRDDESGWVWCRSRTGGEGWVPIDTLRMSD